MEDIRNWLNSKRDYAAGVQLYVEHGNDDLLKRLFTQEGYSEYKFKRLLPALEELLQSKKKAGNSTPAKKINVTVPIVDKETDQNKSFNKWSKVRDKVEESLFLQWRQKYSEMINLSARIGDLSKQATKNNDKSKIDEAGRMALKILDLDDECNELFRKRDFYKIHGRLPGDEDPFKISLDPSLWYKKLHNHQRYVRKFRDRIAKDASDTKAAALLKTHEWAVIEYKKLLKMD